jgi:hypothetical protein
LAASPVVSPEANVTAIFRSLFDSDRS